MMLHADLRLTLGQLELGIELDLSANETVALVGPNGAGKTNVLRCLAGLSPIDAGRIELDGVVLDEPAVGTARGDDEPSNWRSVTRCMSGRCSLERFSPRWC